MREFDLYPPMQQWLKSYLEDKYKSADEIIVVDAHSERLDRVLRKYDIVQEEAFLMTSADLGSLNKLLNVYKREDLLDFGDGKRIKKMKIAIWNMQTNAPDPASMIPKI